MLRYPPDSPVGLNETYNFYFIITSLVTYVPKPLSSLFFYETVVELENEFGLRRMSEYRHTSPFRPRPKPVIM